MFHLVNCGPTMAASSTKNQHRETQGPTEDEFYFSERWLLCFMSYNEPNEH